MAVTSEHCLCTLFGFVSHRGHVPFFVQLSSWAPFWGKHRGVSAVPLSAAVFLDVGRHWLAQSAITAGVIKNLSCSPLSHWSFWNGAGCGSVGHRHSLFCSKTPISVYKLVLSIAETHIYYQDQLQKRLLITKGFGSLSFREKSEFLNRVFPRNG